MNIDGKSRVPPIYPMGKSLTVLLREARLEALEEAARLADKAADELLVDDGGTACANLAAEIRALRREEAKLEITDLRLCRRYFQRH